MLMLMLMLLQHNNFIIVVLLKLQQVQRLNRGIAEELSSSVKHDLLQC